MEKLVAKASIQIQKNANEVFENIVNPDRLIHYFISETSGRIEENSELIWVFPEFEEKFVVSVRTVISGKQIVFIWDPETIVTIELFQQEDDSTIVKVTEDGKPNNEKGIQWFGENTGGWMNFLDCLKAFSEYGINLRKGAFDFLKKHK